MDRSHSTRDSSSGRAPGRRSAARRSAAEYPYGIERMLSDEEFGYFPGVGGGEPHRGSHASRPFTNTEREALAVTRNVDQARMQAELLHVGTVFENNR
jgi:hypothetical protein